MKRLFSLARRIFTMNRINTGTFSIQDLCVWHVVLAVCAILFILINSGKERPLTRAVRFGCYDRERISQGQWWRLLTVGFTHIRPWHIAMNMLALYNLSSLERIYGHLWFTVILLGSVIGGSVLEYVISKTRYSVGLSGGLYGLMFSLILLMIHYHSTSGLRSMGITLAMNLAINFMPGIAWQAHVGGAISGLVLTEIFLLIH